ncbi:MAG: CopG family transcriptional regulator [Chloroflexota bacterium]
MQRTNIYLERAQTEALDRRAAEAGISRAEVIRRLLDEALAGPHVDLEADLSAIGESFGALASMEPVTRGRDARGRHLERVARSGG